MSQQQRVRVTQVAGIRFTRRVDLPKAGSYFQWECESCHDVVSGSGLSLHSHATSNKHRVPPRGTQ